MLTKCFNPPKQKQYACRATAGLHSGAMHCIALLQAQCTALHCTPLHRRDSCVCRNGVPDNNWRKRGAKMSGNKVRRPIKTHTHMRTQSHMHTCTGTTTLPNTTVGRCEIPSHVLRAKCHRIFRAPTPVTNKPSQHTHTNTHITLSMTARHLYHSLRKRMNTSSAKRGSARRRSAALTSTSRAEALSELRCYCGR